MKAKKILILNFFLITQNLIYGQCTGCTSTITSNTSTGIIVSSGQTVCIAPSIVINGGIIINSGGTLCNEGIINSGIEIQGGGELNNYGEIDASGIENRGIFNNYKSVNGLNVFNMDTLNNWGQINIKGFSVITNGYLNNTSSGKILVRGGFSLGDTLYPGKVDNYGCMEVEDGFSIFHTNSVFYTETMITVGGGWSNSGTVNGSTVSCGGFKVAQGTSNLGIYGVTGKLDMCDTGNPTSGFDSQSGTVGTNVTYCFCQNYCAISGINNSDQYQNQISLYPNPAGEFISIQFDKVITENGSIEIINILGQNVYTEKLPKGTKTEINIESIPAGVYFIKFNTNDKNQAQKFIKE
ncbi:MAG: T9SS type A sorting domain-containing protein [Bacteroidetes bacterium]|nr:T9SS type A sorting domain-containing protein [Bacteroidota bacterium]